MGLIAAPTIEELSAMIDGMIEHADRFFAGATTKEQLFELIEIANHNFSDMIAAAAKRGALTAFEIATYQWSSCTMAAMLRTLELEPQYGSDALERQLKANFRAMLKTAKIMRGHVVAPGQTRQ